MYKCILRCAALVFALIFLGCGKGEAVAQAQMQDAQNVQGTTGQNAKQNAESARRYTDTIRRVFDFIENNYVDEVQAQKLYEGAMKGLLEALDDPYSEFLPAKEMEELNESVVVGNYGGVGLYITKPVSSAPDKPAWVEVASPIEDTPGWRAGIQPGDYITEVNGTPTETMTMDDVLGQLKGPAGETVNVKILRGVNPAALLSGGGLTIPVTLTREIIEVPTVKHALINDANGKATIGYLKLLTFSSHTAERSREAINDFIKQGYQSLIIDLRNNYGGLLESAVEVGDLFLSGGTVVSVKSRVKQQNEVFTAKRKSLVDAAIPIIVLINRGSASASEIVAGALKDRGRAYLVGEKSYGKGSVQQVYPLGDAGMKLTTARYYTPSDVNIDKIGIPPDKEVLFPSYTVEQTKALAKMIEDNAIPAFVKDNPKASQSGVDAFVAKLIKEYDLSAVEDAPQLLHRLVRDEQRRTDMPLVYDLDYDVQLKAAVDILNKGQWRSLVAATKTLAVLQKESAASGTSDTSGSSAANEE